MRSRSRTEYSSSQRPFPSRATHHSSSVPSSVTCASSCTGTRSPGLRKDDPAGALVDADSDGLTELDPVEKQVDAEGERKPGDLVPVQLEAHVTELGTLELWCVARDGKGRWKLEYSVRARE